MSLLIKGVKLTDCWNCPCVDGEYGECNVLGKAIKSVRGRLDDCPLIELPDHGDLKDVDAIIGNMQSLFDEREEEARYTGNRNVTVSWNDAVYLVKSAPVIIPAESEIDKWWERSETVNAERSEDGEA